ncbi:plastocyanin/azurin family copper-binding protein [Paraconexibacter sp.]|uniref:plastocyanin/azurin family copper-binding protein n=1 Tax=Paraconexibacter sp. TaxID=2949640 RepID=UPI00356A1497
MPSSRPFPGAARPAVLAIVAVAAALLVPTAASAASAGSSAKTSSCERLAAATGDRPSEQRWTCTWGPIDIGAYQVRQDVTFGLPRPPVDGSVTNMSVDVTDRDRTRIPIRRLMLHHIVFLNLGSTLGEKRDRTCDAFEMWDSKTSLPGFGERFYAAGEERAVLDLPDGYGYPSPASDGWAMTWMVMNHRGRADRAYITYDVTIDTAPDLQPAVPYWLDVRNCKADPVYDVPGGGKKGSVHTRRMHWTVPESGRLIAGAGHVHGGGKELRVTQRSCGNRTLIRSRPAWGLSSNPFYKVKPILHEPGPIAMSALRSPTGIPVAAGERLTLSSIYDNRRLHTRVMGIMVVFLAPDPAVTQGCAALPADTAEIQTTRKHRKVAPRFTVPLTGLDDDGRAVTIKRPSGKTKKLRSGSTITVGDQYFRAANVKVRRGATLRWKFASQELHNVTVASGPRGFASDNLDGGRVYRKKLTARGTYKIFCALHPVTMTATVKVTK